MFKERPARGKLQYFKKQNGSFQRIEEAPFADLLINEEAYNGPVGIIPRFVDWDGDGDMDLVITGLDKVRFFQRGVLQALCLVLQIWCLQSAHIDMHV